MNEFIMATDGYKIGHPAMIRAVAPGTTRIYENWTARGGRTPGVDSVPLFLLQHYCKRHLMDLANATFFSRPKSDVLYDYRKFLDAYFGAGHGVTVDHIAALHELGYIPVEFCALPEGTWVPYRVPMLTIENTHDDFAWVPGYLETSLSYYLWRGCTNAEIGHRFYKMFANYAELTGGDPGFVPYQGHDFSLRGLDPAGAMIGAGHLLSFVGTDSVPAIQLLHDDYDGEALIGCSVPASEHSIMCLGGSGLINETRTFRKLLRRFPTGILSLVSDTWSLWDVLTKILPDLKEEIMARDGKLVIRPDSGDPVLIMTGDASANELAPKMGVIRVLDDLFGHTLTWNNFRRLDSHIGTIYGDSISYERGDAICSRLKDLGYASTNWVAGIGSYTYQLNTRDNNGFAVKATWAMTNGNERFLFKDPVTDTGTKKSARGRLAVTRERDGSLKLTDGLDLGTHRDFERIRGQKNLLEPVWRDGRFLKRHTLAEVRERIRS